MDRPLPRRRLPRFAAFALAGAAGALAVASPAWAAPAISPGSGAVWNANTAPPSFSVSDPTGDPVNWTATGPGFSLSGSLPGGGGSVTLTGFPDGGGTLTATNTADLSSDLVTFTVDTTPPIVTLAPVGTPRLGWYGPTNPANPAQGIQIQPTCSDAVTPPVSGCAAFPWTTEGLGVEATRVGTDGAGNQTTGSVIFNYDATKPTAGANLAPVDDEKLAQEPDFRWTEAGDSFSGVDKYELQYRNVAEDGAFVTIAEKDHIGAVDYFVPASAVPPLPERQLLEWRVLATDNAGNFRGSTPFRLTIDPTVPSPPLLTGGPSGPIRFTSPTFTWNGTQGDFHDYEWDLFLAGHTTPLRSGNGPEREAAVQSLSDGDYTFRVLQLTPFGVPSQGATRSFKVDTTPPAAPTITARPPFPAAGTITFAWSTEPGAFSRWQIIGAGGAVIIGPSDTPLNSVSVTNLSDGAYSFQVLQIDGAGNTSATTSEPFTVTNPLAPGRTATTPRVQPEFLLPSQNAARLRPKAGKTVPTRRPVLRWHKGPRGTRLYNVQIFKVVKKRRGANPTVKKVYSGFPSKRQLRAPKSKMRPGTCYVWRVWPYTGTRFTPKPLGISNFCVAKASVLKKKAAQAAARRKAAQRRGR